MADVHFTGKRRLLAGIVVASFLLPVAGCKKTAKKEQGQRYSSGKEILATDPYFETTVSEVKFPFRKGKTVDSLNVYSCEYLEDLAVISYEIFYKIPEEEIEKNGGIVPGYAQVPGYYDRDTGIFDVDGNFIRYLKGDQAQLYDVTTDKDGNICLFYSFIDDWCSTNYKVEIMDREGNTIRSIIIFDPPIAEHDDSDAQIGEVMPEGWTPYGIADANITMLRDGGVAITGHGRIFVYDAGGKRLCKADDWGRSIEGDLIWRNGKYYLQSSVRKMDGKDEIYIRELDVKTGKLGTEKKADSLRGRGQIAATDEGLFVSSFSGCFKYDMDSDELSEVFNWNDTDVDRSILEQIRFHPKDENEFFAVSLVRVRSGVRPYLIHVKRAETNPHAGKKMIVIGGMFVGDTELMSFVDDYNRDLSSKARAIVVDYADGMTSDDPLADVERQLYLDILSGSGPDILVNMGNSEAFRTGQVMEDLNPYMDGPDGISRDKYFDSLFRACERNGKLYHVPIKVRLNGFMVNSDVVPYPDGWTYDEFDACAEKMPADISFMQGTLYNDMLSIFLNTSLPRFVDYEKKTVDFENADMNRLLEMTKKYGVFMIPADEQKKVVTQTYGDGLVESGMHDFAREKFAEGMLAVRPVSICNLNNFCVEAHVRPGQVSFIGYPSPVKTGMAVQPEVSLGIVSAGKYKDLAWDFIRAYLQYEPSVDEISSFLPVNRSLFDRNCQLEMEEENEFFDNWFRKLGRVPPADIYARIDEKDIDNLRYLMEHADVSSGMDRSVYAVIAEEAAAYFAGDRTKEDVLKLITNRTSLIVSEY